jgi:hypothetical protein
MSVPPLAMAGLGLLLGGLIGAAALAEHRRHKMPLQSKPFNFETPPNGGRRNRTKKIKR